MTPSPVRGSGPARRPTPPDPSRRRSPGRGPRRDRAGFTLAEALIAVGIFAMVSAVALGLWSGMARSFFRGEDTRTSVQEASTVLLHLRRDLLAADLGDPARGYDLRLQRVREGDLKAATLRLDLTERVLVRRTEEDEGAGEDRSELTLWTRRGDAAVAREVTWAYLPDQARIERRAEGEATRSFAAPRARDLEVEVEAEPVRPPDDGAPLRMLAGGPARTAPLGRVWFRVRFAVQGEPREGGLSTTRVDLETRVFPRRANLRLRSRWEPTP